jgi:glycosyltransferase involved in cell wall biosynthesis
MTTAPSTTSFALITSMASTLPNFRGDLIAKLVAGGVRVYALAPDYDDRIRERVVALGAVPMDMALDRAGMRPLRDLWDLGLLVQQLRRLKPDVAFSYFAKPVIYGSLAAWLARVPRRYAMLGGMGYVFIQKGANERWPRKVLREMVTWMYSVAFSRVHRVFFQNPDDEALFLRRGLIRAGKSFRVNGTGVDLKRLQPAPAVRGPITFLMMARLLREKGVYEFASAARAVRRIHADVRFVLLGAVDLNPGSLRQDEVEDWVKEGTIHWPGFVDDVRPWIAACSVYVLPSYREGVPRSTQEAMAMGRAIITTDAVGCRETVRDGYNGFLVPVRDAAALAGAMLRFIEEPDLAVSMGAASRRFAEERFDIDRISTTMLGVMGINAVRPSMRCDHGGAQSS